MILMAYTGHIDDKAHDEFRLVGTGFINRALVQRGSQPTLITIIF